MCFADSGVVNRLSLLTDADSADLSHRALRKTLQIMLKVVKRNKQANMQTPVIL